MRARKGKPVGQERQMLEERGRRKVQVGRVVSDKMDKTIVVTSENLVRHPFYKKTIKRTSKFMAHDENSEARVGDLVRITETRPASKKKRWRLVSVIKKAD